jgi:hypothetical protein
VPTTCTLDEFGLKMNIKLPKLEGSGVSSPAPATTGCSATAAAVGAAEGAAVGASVTASGAGTSGGSSVCCSVGSGVGNGVATVPAENK